MKKEQAIIALLVLISLIKSFGQSANPRIEQVENGLIPYVPVAGFAKWNIHERMKYYDVQGVSIVVIRDFKVEWAKAYGMADTAQKMPMTTETMLSAGSISKMVTGFGAFQLVQNKKLALDEPINNYLKSWQLPENDFTKKTPVTLRMLLSHKAGTSQASYWGFTPDVKELPTILDILKGNPVAESRGVVVNSEPNVAFRYSGGGLMVAQCRLWMPQTNALKITRNGQFLDPSVCSTQLSFNPCPISLRSRRRGVIRRHLGTKVRPTFIRNKRQRDCIRRRPTWQSSSLTYKKPIKVKVICCNKQVPKPCSRLRRQSPKAAIGNKWR
jgi:hypothetical protein